MWRRYLIAVIQKIQRNCEAKRSRTARRRPSQRLSLNFSPSGMACARSSTKRAGTSSQASTCCGVSTWKWRRLRDFLRRRSTPTTSSSSCTSARWCKRSWACLFDPDGRSWDGRALLLLMRARAGRLLGAGLRPSSSPSARCS